MSNEPETYYQFVSAVTGRTVSPEFAADNLDTTYKRTVHVKREVVELPEVEDELIAEPMMPPDDL